MVRPRNLALALAPGTLLAGIAGGIVFPIFPIVGLRVGLSLPFIGVILAANRAMRVVTSPWIGMLADRVGARRTLLAGLAIQIGVIALYLLGMETGHAGICFLLGRLLHGIGSACVFVGAQALALHAAGPSQGGSTAGVVRAAIVIGTPIGLAVGGILADVIGETATFAVAGAAVIAALIGATFTVPDLGARVALRSFRDTLAALRDRRMLAIGSLNFVIGFTAGGMLLSTLTLLVSAHHVVLFGRDVQGTSGLLMGWMTILDALATPFAGRWGDQRRAHAQVGAAAMLILVAGLVTIAFAHALPPLVTGLALVGFGTAGLGPSLLVLLGELVPIDRRGTGVGFMQLAGDAGGTLGPLIGTALFAGSSTLPYLATAAFVSLFIPVALWLARLERRATVGT
ncbi:MAG: MFS transporter [Deltaproteobacteria bacterium]|nr:MFS transporter [Deltaproteobacteria bacterium]